MLLADSDIRQWCTNPMYHRGKPLFEPFSEAVQEGGVISYGLTSAGYDLRLGDRVLVFKNTRNLTIDPKRFKDEEYHRQMFDEINSEECVFVWGRGNRIVIPPHSYALGYSLEYIRIPRCLKGRCVGKSTYARCGILINTTPLEPGWEGHLTIEISNISPCPALVFSGEGIAQLELETLSGEPEIDYRDKKGKYQGQQSEPVAARVKE